MTAGTLLSQASTPRCATTANAPVPVRPPGGQEQKSPQSSTPVNQNRAHKARKQRFPTTAHIRDLIDTPADVSVTESEVRVHFHRRAHLPIILASGLLNTPVTIPWWRGHSLRMSA